MNQPGGLARELGLWEVTLSGVGIIFGAGIYALIGVAAGEAGNAVWFAFSLSAAAALFTALSYAELSSMYPRAGAEYEYTAEATGEYLFESKAPMGPTRQPGPNPVRPVSRL